MIAHGIGDTKDEVARLETFFGTSKTSADATKADQQQESLANLELVQFYAGTASRASRLSAPDSSTSFPQPSQTALAAPPSSPLGSAAVQLQESPAPTLQQLLDQLTAEQFSNLQSASHLAADALSQLRGLASSGIDNVQMQLEEAQIRLGPEAQQRVEHLARAIYNQVEEMQRALTQAIALVKQQQVPDLKATASKLLARTQGIKLLSTQTASSTRAKLAGKKTTPLQPVTARQSQKVVQKSIKRATETKSAEVNAAVRTSRTAETSQGELWQRWGDRIGAHLPSVNIPTVAIPSLPDQLTNFGEIMKLYYNSLYYNSQILTLRI